MSDQAGRPPLAPAPGEVGRTTVDPAWEGVKLIRFLKALFGGAIPDGALFKRIRTGQVRVDGRRAGPHDLLVAGSVVRIPPFRDFAPPPGRTSPATLAVALETDDWLVLDKPAGLPVQDEAGDSLESRAKARFADSPYPPRPAHRIDKPTSGLVLFAKSQKALVLAQGWFRKGLVEKTYLAWVESDSPPTGLLEDRLDKRDGGVVRDASGKTALATSRHLLSHEGSSLLALELHTGRTHQLRAQLASRGAPIVGDVRYGAQSVPTSGAILLHAAHLAAPDLLVLSRPGWPGRFAVHEETLAGVFNQRGNGRIDSDDGLS